MPITTPGQEPLVDPAELIADPYAVYARLRQAGHEAVAVQTDVGDPASVERMVEAVVAGVLAQAAAADDFAQDAKKK